MGINEIANMYMFKHKTQREKCTWMLLCETYFP